MSPPLTRASSRPPNSLKGDQEILQPGPEGGGVQSGRSSLKSGLRDEPSPSVSSTRVRARAQASSLKHFNCASEARRRA